MTKEIPKYALRAYGMLYSKYSSDEEFTQDCMNWIISSAMRKKIFSELLNSGWISKKSKRKYVCRDPKDIFTSLFKFKVPELIKDASKDYYFKNMSAVETWTDFSYIQKSWQHSPYFVAINEKDIEYWKNFFSNAGIPYFLEKGTFIGEFIILIPEKKIDFTFYNGFNVQKLKEVAEFCEKNDLFEYPLAYLNEKFDLKLKINKELIDEVKKVIKSKEKIINKS